MVRYPEFRKALFRWRRAALNHLESGTEPSIRRMDLQRWGRHTDGTLRRIDSLHWDFVKLEETYQLPEFKELNKAASGYADIKKHLNVLVGTSYSSRQLTLSEIAKTFLPELRFTTDSEQVDLIPQSASLYKDLEDFIANDNVTVTNLWPIGGLQVEKPLRIKDGVVIRRLNENELINALSYGLVKPIFPEMPIMPTEHEANQSGLFYTHKLPKIIGNQKNPGNDITTLEKEKAVLLENIVTTAAIVGIRGIRFNGRTESSNSWPPGLHSASWNGTPASNRRGFGNVGIKNIKQFEKTWKLHFGHGGSVDKSLYLTARRLAFAEERVRTDDSLLDLMIAAEALYLGSDGAQDRGELKYRLSLRAAQWADISKVKATKKEVFNLMKIAYDIRSTIAHGGTPKASKLKFKGQQLQQVEFNKTVEDIIRLGLQKAILSASHTAGRNFKPSWDDKLLSSLSR